MVTDAISLYDGSPLHSQSSVSNGQFYSFAISIASITREDISFVSASTLKSNTAVLTPHYRSYCSIFDFFISYFDEVSQRF
jgi:hypothetical protein